jgi:hypothetical protein
MMIRERGEAMRIVRYCIIWLSTFLRFVWRQCPHGDGYSGRWTMDDAARIAKVSADFRAGGVV